MPSQCAIVKATGRSTGALEVLGRRNRTQNHTTNSQRKKKLLSVFVKSIIKPVKPQRASVTLNLCLQSYKPFVKHL